MRCIYSRPPQITFGTSTVAKSINILPVLMHTHTCTHLDKVNRNWSCGQHRIFLRFMYLFDRESEKQRDLLSTSSFPNDCNSRDEARPKPGAWNFILVSFAVAEAQALGLSTGVFPEASTGSWFGSAATGMEL